MAEKSKSPTTLKPEDKVLVQDYAQPPKPVPVPVSRYLSADISARLVSSGAARTLSVMDQEIISLDAIIESLQALKIIKRKARNECSQISRLPLEILAEIFITCLAHDEIVSSDDRLNKLAFPLVLGQVSTTWRSVAWGLAPLWTTIHCRVSHPDKSKKLARLLYQWLLRARELPISVTIDFVNEERWVKLGINAPTDILDALMPFSGTWKVLDIILPASWQRYLNGYYPSRLICLEELRIRPPSPFQDHDIDMEGFLGAPKLRSIVYDSYPLRHLYLTWVNLVHGTFGRPSLDEVVKLLSRCTNLITCCISNPVPNESIHTISPVTHTRLQQLRIESRSGGQAFQAAVQILDFLTAPLLQNISLILPLQYSNPLPNILDLIRRSKCPLRHVEVYGPAVGEAQIIDFLSESSVIHLHNG